MKNFIENSDKFIIGKLNKEEAKLYDDLEEKNIFVQMIYLFMGKHKWIMIIMMVFAGPVGRFVNKHPSIQMLGLSFLILIGFMLIAEACHMGNISLFNQHVGVIPKGYLYFAISFSLLVEFLNLKMKKNKTPKA